MKFIVESASSKDYTKELTEAGVKFEVEHGVLSYPFADGFMVRVRITTTIADLDSLEDLMTVKQTVGHDIIIGRECTFDEYPKITVFDGCLE